MSDETKTPPEGMGILGGVPYRRKPELAPDGLAVLSGHVGLPPRTAIGRAAQHVKQMAAEVDPGGTTAGNSIDRLLSREEAVIFGVLLGKLVRESQPMGMTEVISDIGKMAAVIERAMKP